MAAHEDLPRDLHYNVPPFPPELLGQNEANITWGVSFDIYLRPSIDLPPYGWGGNRGYVYRKLRDRFRDRDFVRDQYSDYISAFACNAEFCWDVMFNAMRIQPPGRMETTVKKLRMHSIVEYDVQDVSEGVRLGGVYSRRIRGPIPLNLVPLGVAQNLVDIPIWPVPIHFLPPAGTRRNAASMNPDNWIT